VKDDKAFLAIVGLAFSPIPLLHKEKKAYKKERKGNIEEGRD
jgi:hypothetical protein